MKYSMLPIFNRKNTPNVLEGLYHYFAFGREFISEDDLAGRLAVDGKIFLKEQMLKGFAYQYQTVISSDAATDRQILIRLIKRLNGSNNGKKSCSF